LGFGFAGRYERQRRGEKQDRAEKEHGGISGVEWQNGQNPMCRSSDQKRQKAPAEKA
jgi:hypothetical protein